MDVHTIYLVGETTLNYMLTFLTLEYLISSSCYSTILLSATPSITICITAYQFIATITVTWCEHDMDHKPLAVLQETLPLQSLVQTRCVYLFSTCHVTY